MPESQIRLVWADMLLEAEQRVAAGQRATTDATMARNRAAAGVAPAATVDAAAAAVARWEARRR